MSIIYVLIPIAMLFVLIAVGVFFWAVKSEQYDDLDRQGVSILFDDEVKKAVSNKAVDHSSEHNAATKSSSSQPSDLTDTKPL